jgi:Tol biopolymer transport system component
MRGGLVLAVAAVALSCTSQPSSSTATPSASGATAAPTVAATAQPATPLAGAGALTARATTVPREWRYITAAEPKIGRIWLVDLDRGTSVDVVAAKGEPNQSYFAPTFSASADGKHLVVSAVGPNARSALYRVDVESGRSALLYEDATIQCVGCLFGTISPDGQSYAFADHSGVRVGRMSDGSNSQLVPHVDPATVSGTWQPRGWSVDGALLAIWRGSEGTSDLALVRVATGQLTALGHGDSVAWRARSPQAVVTSGINAFGGRSEMYTYDLATTARRQLEPVAQKRFSGAAWHPSEDRILFLSADGPLIDADVFVRSLTDDAAKQVPAPRKVWDAWWSRDGSRIFATIPRPDALADAPGVANLNILDLAVGRVVATVCRGDPRAACP